MWTRMQSTGESAVGRSEPGGGLGGGSFLGGDTCDQQLHSALGPLPRALSPVLVSSPCALSLCPLPGTLSPPRAYSAS